MLETAPSTAAPRLKAEVPRLRRYLDRFLETFPKEVHLRMDPVQFVRRYDDKTDREIVAFLASSFAYGNVRSVLNSVQTIVSVMGPCPAGFLSAFDPGRDGERFSGFRHRWNNQKDLTVLLWILKRLFEEYGSMEAAFAAQTVPGRFSVEKALNGLSRTALGFGHERFYSARDLRERIGIRYFFPQPSGGSACKRLNLFLRWMVRADDGIDCGVWDHVTPDLLVAPLDTHISRIARYIGLTDVRTAGWKMAVGVTEGLRRLDRTDPLRYDFALCHLGIAGDCPKQNDPLKCRRCPIQPVCQL